MLFRSVVSLKCIDGRFKGSGNVTVDRVSCLGTVERDHADLSALFIFHWGSHTPRLLGADRLLRILAAEFRRLLLGTLWPRLAEGLGCDGTGFRDDAERGGNVRDQRG